MEIGSRWMRNTPYDPSKGGYNGYTVFAVTNTANLHPNHPPQVIYQGDNGHLWSLPLAEWPGNLVPEVRYMDHELKFKSGDKVRVVADKFRTSHGAKIGGVYIIETVVKESREGLFESDYQEYSLKGSGWVCEDEIEAV